MKISNPDTIEESEKEFIDMINAELDWDVIETLLLEKHNFTLEEEIEYKNGDIIIHDNSIAYKFDFSVKVPLSIVFNRNGEFLEFSTVQPEKSENNALDHMDKNNERPKIAADIADMISEINQED